MFKIILGEFKLEEYSKATSLRNELLSKLNIVTYISLRDEKYFIYLDNSGNEFYNNDYELIQKTLLENNYYYVIAS